MFYVFKTMQNLSGGKTICLDTEWELETNWETGVIWIEDFKKICRVVVPKLLTYAGVDPNTVDMSGELRYVEVMRGTRNLIEKKRIIRVIREGAIRYYIE